MSEEGGDLCGSVLQHCFVASTLEPNGSFSDITIRILQKSESRKIALIRVIRKIPGQGRPWNRLRGKATFLGLHTKFYALNFLTEFFSGKFSLDFV